MENFGIYVHIPFCVAKCNYCNFASKYASNEEIDRYIAFLCKEIKQKSSILKNKLATSIYIGGGTPSFVDSKHIVRIIEIIRNNYNVLQGAEITIECNPCSTTKQKLQDYKNAGINRISFGVQSLNDNELEIIGRKHTAKMAKEAILEAKEVGYENISADLLIGIPEQTNESLLNNIQQLINLGVKHISAYMLILEEGTQLYNQVSKNMLLCASEDESVNMYNNAYSLLKNLGYERYEISNFAKKGYESKHNVNYWELGEYIGFGVSAHSFYNGKRIANSNTFNGYYKGIQDVELLSNEETIEEIIMLGLRQEKGVSISKLYEYGYDILKKRYEQIDILIKNNLIKIENDYIKIMPDKFGLTSAIILELI